MFKKRFISLLVLLMTAVSGAWAETITVKYALKAGDTFTSGQTVEVKNDTEEVVATITYGESGGEDFNGANDDSNVSGYTAYTNGNGTNGNKAGGTFYTITPKVDATITVAVALNADKKFYIEEDGTALADYNGITVSAKYYGTYEFDATANKAYKVYSAGSKLGFYGFAMTYSPVVPVTDPATKYNLTLADGTEDATNWTITPAEATTTGVAAGTEVKATYSGTKHVKSVKAKKKAAAKPAATVTTAPTATAARIAVSTTKALVSAGAADGGTLMYAVTTTNTQPTSTDGFSATIPTAEGRAAGNYYVWYYAKGDADHSDSEIAGPVSVTMEVAAFILGGEGIITNSRLQFTFRVDDEDNNVWADWNGTSFTCGHGSGDYYGNAGARVSVNGAVISLGVSDDWDDDDFEGFTVNFNTSNNTYTITKGSFSLLPYDVTSVKVNGVEVKGNLTKQ